MPQGTILKVNCLRGFGFIGRVGERDIFFHRTALADGLIFDGRLVELRVVFDEYETAKGPRAVNVRPAI